MEDGSTFAELLGHMALTFAVIHKWYIHYIHHVIRDILHVQAQPNIIRLDIYPTVLQILPTLQPPDSSCTPYTQVAGLGLFSLLRAAATSDGGGYLGGRRDRGISSLFQMQFVYWQ